MISLEKSKKRPIFLIILILLIIIYIALFFTLAILRYYSFFSYEWEDLAVNNQILCNISKGQLFPETIILGGGPLGTHTLFIFFLLSFLYIIFSPSIFILFLTVTLFLAIAAIPIYLIASRIIKSELIAFFLALAYLFYAPKNSLNFLDGDPIIFTIPLLLFAFYSGICDYKFRFFLCSFLAMLCKTNAPIYTAALALYFLFIYRNNVKLNKKNVYLIILFFSLALLIISLIINYKFGKIGLLSAFYKPAFTLPLRAAFLRPFSLFSTPHFKALLQVFIPLFFLPVFSLEFYICLTSLFEILFTKYFVFQRAHYISGMIPFLFIGTIYSIARTGAIISNYLKIKNINFNQKQVHFIFALIVLVGCFFSNFGSNIIGSPYPEECGQVQDKRFLDAKNIYDKRFYTMDGEDSAAWELIKMIPLDASVSASGDLLIPLSNRRTILEFLSKEYNYLSAEYILIHNKNMYMGAGHYEWDDARMIEELDRLLKSKDWALLGHKKDFFLFKRNKETRSNVIF